MKETVKNSRNDTRQEGVAPRPKTRALALALALGLGMGLGSVSPAWAGHANVGVGIGFGAAPAWGGTSFSGWYGHRHHGGSSWALGLTLANPYYWNAYPPPPYWGPSYYSAYPGWWSAGYYRNGRHNRHHSRADWGVSWHGAPAWGAWGYQYYGYPPPYAYAPPASQWRGAYGWTVAPSVSLGYASGRHHGWSVGVGIPLGIALAAPAARPPRPSMSDSIARGGPVEANPIVKRVWVPGHYETSTGASNAASATGTSGRVWIPGAWEYVPSGQ